MDQGPQVIEADLRLNWPSQRLHYAFELDEPGITAVFGPSGSGKTSLLRCIAGLEPASIGHLQVGGRSWQSPERRLPTHQRRLGYVFQEPSLFTHLDVGGNLRFGWRRTPRAERRIGFTEVVAGLGLSDLLDRMPGALSGGQRQRVAIARALLTNPDLLLMDEPVAALDQAAKRDILSLVQHLSTSYAIPILYVSHDLVEIQRLADWMLYLEGGQVRASGPINRLLTAPELPLAQSPDAGSVLAVHLVQQDPRYALSEVSLDGAHQLWVAQIDRPLGSAVKLRISARDVSLARTRATHTSITNVLPARVIDIRPDPDPAQVLVRLALGDSTLLSRITRRSADHLSLRSGEPIFAQIKSVALMDP
ncbi:MAG: molybdenum ABC transporter ATP-binding protein [Pseudomonadota bacterium]|nr:molybdenum ABC transporter ATP-binding protein [Pseudomonadota bacterium]